MSRVDLQEVGRCFIEVAFVIIEMALQEELRRDIPIRLDLASPVATIAFISEANRIFRSLFHR